MSNLAINNAPNKIRLLPDLVINKIAAGEVIERPAAVIRELVDNSVDAGAKDIALYIIEGGKQLIRVVDDGCGMSPEDALLAFERHATSKLQNVNDLESISTKGFRGEALASIAAVAKVRLKTKTLDQALATEVRIEGGKLIKVEQVSGNLGTEIEILNLFFNTPARKKFLKAESTEEKKIKQWLASYAYAHPQIRFRLFCDSRESLNISPKSDFFERARLILKQPAMEVKAEFDRIKIQGLLTHPSMAQAQSSSLTILVNHRLVQDRMILRAVKEGYDSTLKSFEIPYGVISIELPADQVDVNVHPQKSEVRFVASQSVFVAVRQAVLLAIKNFKSPQNSQSSDFVSQKQYQNVAVQSSNNFLNLREAAPAFQNKSENMSPSFGQNHTANQRQVALPVATSNPINSSAEITNQSNKFAFHYTDLNYIGQVLTCYLVFEHEFKMYIIDMHAAHERVNYNLIRKSFENKNLTQQALIIPITIELGYEGVDRCLKSIEIFNQFGFEIEAFGETTLIIRQVPSIITPSIANQLIKEIAANDLEHSQSGKFVEIIDHICARLACHASMRSGKVINRAEVQALLAQLDETELAGACPHGRPVIVEFNATQIENWFGRDR